MRWLITAALRQRVLVLALAVVLMAFGIHAARVMPLDVFPEFAPPLVEIQTEAPGLSTEEVESLITVPLESAVNGTSWLKTLRSKSVLGLASVVCIFQEGTDLMRARQLIQERVALVAPRLPAVARAPVILPPLSSTSRALKIGVSSKTLSQMDLSELALWTIRPRLMAVPGVANVAIWGQRDRQLQIRVDPDRLAAHGITLDAVTRAAGDAAAVVAGGFVDLPSQRLPVRHLANVTTPEDLARTVVQFTGGVPLRLGDVAEIVESHPPPIGDAVINDGPGLLLIVEKQPWGNTLEVTRQVEAALAVLRPGLGDVEIDPTIFRPATFIERALDNLTEALIIGCVLVAVILVAFLFEWRTALISLSAIPLSLLAAAVVLYLRGGTLNTMVLAGLVIAVGEVVDDAIVDVENITRRLRLNRAAERPLSPFRVVLKASLEVRSAVVFASLIIALVFVPVFFLDGVAGTFFRPLAFSYLLAILASLLVALTVTPALCSLLAMRRALDAFGGGKILIGIAGIPYKCPPAPLEVAFLIESEMRDRGLRDRTEIQFLSPVNRAFTIESVSEMATPILSEKGIDLRLLAGVDGVIVPGGFGERGASGKIEAVKFARERQVPYFGICFGMQMAVIEAARHLCNLPQASSTEFGPTNEPVIGLMTEWMKDGELQTRREGGDLGGTMRLGAYEAVLTPGSKIADIYGVTTISERHRHRYEVNPSYVERLENAGLVFSGVSPSGKLMEIAEIPKKIHPFMLGSQFHPEFTARPLSPNPLFAAFMKVVAARNK